MSEKAPNFRYAVPDHDENSLYDLFCPHTGPGDLGWVAEAAADDYHSEHDGWESTWPLWFIIYDMRGNRLGQCSVDRETVPQFRASNVTLG
jgi:hypothetical protein